MTPPAHPHTAKPPPQTARGFFLDPDRRAAAGFGGGLLALLAGWLVSGSNGIGASYLAAWSCLFALPMGALPVVIMIERVDAWRPQPETALLETLRWLLSLMPAAALLALPLLLVLPEAYPVARVAAPPMPLAGPWFTTPFVLARLAAYVAIWFGLAVLFARRRSDAPTRAGRRGDVRAALALGLHVAVGALAAGDLVTATAEPFHSPLSGLLLMAAWSGLALAAAILVAPPDIGPSRRRLDRLTPLSVLLTIWALLHVAQFLVSRSAELPNAVAWYAARGGTEGGALIAFSGFVVLLAALLTLRPGENRTRLVAALALVMHCLEMSWFVTPSLRGSFKVSLADLLVTLGVAGFAVGLMPLGRRLMPDATLPRPPSRRKAVP